MSSSEYSAGSNLRPSGSRSSPNDKLKTPPSTISTMSVNCSKKREFPCESSRFRAGRAVKPTVLAFLDLRIRELSGREEKLTRVLFPSARASSTLSRSRAATGRRSTSTLPTQHFLAGSAETDPPRERTAARSTEGDSRTKPVYYIYVSVS